MSGMYKCGHAALAGLFVLITTGCVSGGAKSRETDRFSRAGIELNQRAIEGASAALPRGFAPGVTATASSGDSEVSFADPLSVLEYVLRSSPEPAIVYPTEQYYYYRFSLGGRSVSGNIRFVDANSGRISVGYFDAENPSDLQVRELGAREGVSVEPDPDGRTIIVGANGQRRTFLLDQEAFNGSPPALMDGERLVSGIRDESGYFLWLLYWHPGRCLYYVLNADKPVPERWVRGESQSVETWFGEKSRFCFARHTPSGRLILVGVHRRNIELNTWYDGPFDQVPPRLPIRELLEEAYPYVKDAGGIDEHGNFVKMAGQRVAISPYMEYESGPSLEHTLQSLMTNDPTPLAWTKATYEYKRDWRAPSVQTLESTHVMTLSKRWPANHWGISSRAWGPAESHDAALSVSWPPNHRLSESATSSPASP